MGVWSEEFVRQANTVKYISSFHKTIVLLKDSPTIIKIKIILKKIKKLFPWRNVPNFQWWYIDGMWENMIMEKMYPITLIQSEAHQSKQSFWSTSDTLIQIENTFDIGILTGLQLHSTMCSMNLSTVFSEKFLPSPLLKTTCSLYDRSPSICLVGKLHSFFVSIGFDHSMPYECLDPCH